MSTSTTCSAVREWIDEAKAEELENGFGDAFIGEHLGQCGACRETFQRELMLNAAIAQWEVPEPRTNIQARVMAAVARREVEKRRLGFRARRAMTVRVRVPAYALVAAILLFALSISWNLFNFHTSSRKATAAAFEQTPYGGASSISHVPVNYVSRTPEIQTVAQIPPYLGVRAGSAGATMPMIVLILGSPADPAAMPLKETAPEHEI